MAYPIEERRDAGPSPIGPGGPSAIARAAARASIAMAGLTIATVGWTQTAEADWVSDAAFDAIVAGRAADGAPRRICRVFTQTGAVVLGQMAAGAQQCTPLVSSAQPLTRRFETLQPSWTRDGSAGASFGLDSDGKTALGICRATVAGGLHPGKKLSTVDACAVPYGGQEQWVSTYEVLTQTGPFAIEEVAAGGVLRQDAIVGGYEADGMPLYLCVGTYQGGTHPGKTRRDWTACAVSWGGGEQWTTDYRVFVPVFRPLDQDTERWPIARAGSSDGAGICTIEHEGAAHLGSYAFRERKCTFSRGTERLEVFIDVGWLPFTTLRAPRR